MWKFPHKILKFLGKQLLLCFMCLPEINSRFESKPHRWGTTAPELDFLVNSTTLLRDFWTQYNSTGYDNIESQLRETSKNVIIFYNKVRRFWERLILNCLLIVRQPWDNLKYCIMVRQLWEESLKSILICSLQCTTVLRWINLKYYFRVRQLREGNFKQHSHFFITIYDDSDRVF